MEMDDVVSEIRGGEQIHRGVGTRDWEASQQPTAGDGAHHISSVTRTAAPAGLSYTSDFAVGMAPHAAQSAAPDRQPLDPRAAASIVTGPLVKISGAPAPSNVSYPTAAARNAVNGNDIGGPGPEAVPGRDGSGTSSVFSSHERGSKVSRCRLAWSRERHDVAVCEWRRERAGDVFGRDAGSHPRGGGARALAARVSLGRDNQAARFLRSRERY